MILIDSLYINYGGGLQLLRYLVNNLQERKVDFLLLQDSRAEGFDEVTHKTILPASMKARKAWYKQHGNEFPKVLCFGNVPPPIRLKAKVYTYFHNINILKIPAMFTWIAKLKNYVKQRVMDFYGKNTDVWIVQTDNTAWEMRTHFRSGNKPCLVLPFYKISPELRAAKNTPLSERTDYALVGELSYSRGHGTILEVWKRLHEMGFDRTLHLTVSHDTEIQKTFCKRVEALQKEGVQIVNHGFVPFKDVIEIYRKSKAIVYPSLNESLGLSIIEAIEAGCDVITSDLPFAHAICVPSKVFMPDSIDDICKQILEYERTGSNRSELKIHDCINELIDLIL